MYDIGDKVVYPMQGAGVVESIEVKEILGESRKYYILRLPINDLEVMVPVDNAEELGVRYIFDKDKMDEVLELLGTYEDVDVPKNWNRRYRFNMDRIKSGDIFDVAKVLRSLQRLDNVKNLSTGERKLLNGAKQIIVSEMVLVYNKSLDEINNLIEERILG